MAQYLFETLTVGGTAIGPTTTRIGMDPARKAEFVREVVNIRYRYDGGAPTPTVGLIVQSSEVVVVEGADAVRNLKFVSTGASATVTLTLEGP